MQHFLAGSAWSIALEHFGTQSDAVMILEFLRGNIPRWQRATMILQKMEDEWNDWFCFVLLFIFYFS